jgi:hypothetical protein
MRISRCCAGKRCVGAKTTSRPCRPQIRRFRILSTIGQRTTGALCAGSGITAFNAGAGAKRIGYAAGVVD